MGDRAVCCCCDYGVIPPTFTRTDVLFWVMWPATGMLVAGGLTALVLRWRMLERTFRGCRRPAPTSTTFPLQLGRDRRRSSLRIALVVRPVGHASASPSG